MLRRGIKKDKQNKVDSHTSVIAIVSSIVILVGIILLSYNYILSKKVMAYDYMANVFYLDSQKEKEEKPNQNQDNGSINNLQTSTENGTLNTSGGNNNSAFQYIGYLEIPKINLKKGFVDKNSQDNDVEKNLYVATNSSYPDVDKGNLIIAAHSGNGWKAFFNNLYKLSKGDQAVVTYNSKKYTYNIVNIYKQNKTGQIAIYRNYDKTTLTLVTCTNDDDKTQTIYIAELISIS